VAAGTLPLYCWHVDIDESNDKLLCDFGGGRRGAGGILPVKLSHGRYWARGCTNQQDDLFGNLQAAIREIEDLFNFNQAPGRTVVRWSGDNYRTASNIRGRQGTMEIVAQTYVRIMGAHPQNTFDAQEFGASLTDEAPNVIFVANAIPWDGSSVPAGLDRPRCFVSTHPYNVKRTWVPEREFVYDSEDYPIGRSSSGTCMDGITTRTVQWGTRHNRDVRHDVLLPKVIFQSEEVRLFQSLQRFHAWYSAGREFEFHPDMSGMTQFAAGHLWGRYVMGDDSRDPWPAETATPTARLFDVALTMLRTKQIQSPVTGPGLWAQAVEGIDVAARP
jgi:hypothetical protein